MGQPGTKGERGQVAILFALVFTFMFIMFGFVVDYANLVNNKINLQNAADAAAYTGAAYEAQTLNRLSMINYRLRQTVKEFAMRAMVTHLRHNRNFPRGPEFYNGANQAAPVQPYMCQQAHGYVALSGLRYANDTNLCRNASPETGGLPPIVVPPVIAGFDPFAVAIAAQIRKIAEASNQECRAGALDNRALAQHLIGVYSARGRFFAGQMDEVANFLNDINNFGNPITQQDGDGIQHPIVRSAFESARRNLTIGNAENIQMQIMQPSGGEYVRLIEHDLRASLFFFDFNVVGNGCVGRPGFVDFDGMPVGKSKDQAILTYFAVKLSAKPKMMFMPQAWVDAGFPEIVAFAAAKPFGGRIGPDNTADQLLPVPNRPGNINRMLNFSFVPNDPFGIRNAKIMAYFDALHPFNGAGRPDGNRQSGWPEPDKGNNRLALQAIRAPTIFDAMFYTIFPDPNRANDYEESAYAEALYPDYLEVGDPGNNLIQTTPPSTKPYFSNQGIQNGNGWIPAHSRNSGVGDGYAGYAEEQMGSHSVTLAAGLPLITDENAKDFGFASRAMVHSGWSPQRDATRNQGRIGYSVKFISFDALMRTIRVRRSDTGQAGPIDNQPTGDDNLGQIYH